MAGYDPSQYAINNWALQEYERQEAEAIRSGKRRYIRPMSPEEKQKQELQAIRNVSLMSALFDSEYWKLDVWPRLKEYYGVAKDEQFWKEDVRRNIKPALKKTAQSATAGLLGAPMDIAVLAAHTLWWVSDNIGLSDRGHYDWLDDMPDFKQFPTTSDSLMKTLFDEEPEGIEWIAGNLLSPDPAFIAKASFFIGPMVGFPRYIASLGDDTVQVRNAYKNYEDARYYKGLVESGEMTHSEMIAETGWSVSPNGELQMYIDSSDASFNWDVIDDHLVNAINDAVDSGARRTKVKMRTGDIFDHPMLRQIYGEEYGDFSTELSIEKVPKGKYIQGRGGYAIQDANGDWWQVSEDGGTVYGAVMQSEIQHEKSVARVRGRRSRDYPGQKIQDQAAMRQMLEEMLVHEYRHGLSAIEGFIGGGGSGWYEDIITNHVQVYLKNQIPLLVLNSMNQGVDVVSKEFLDLLTQMYPTVAQDRIRQLIQKGRSLHQLPADSGMIEDFQQGLQEAEDGLFKILDMTAGSPVEREAVDIFAKKIDSHAIEIMSKNLYGRLGDEQAARMQEYLWVMREKNPETRMELARKYAIEDSFTFMDLPPYIEALFGPNYDPTAPIKGLNWANNPQARSGQSLDNTGYRWHSYFRGDPARKEADLADELKVEIMDDGVVDLAPLSPQSDPLQPEGPVFDRGRETQRTLSTRGGTTGGLLDTSYEERIRGGLPEGTQQVGTPEDLFPRMDKPTVEVPGQDHYSNYEGILTEEMAIDELLNKRPGNGAVREAANKLLHGEPMKYKSDEWLLEKASELGIEAKKLSDKELKLKIKRENYLKSRQQENLPQSEEPPIRKRISTLKDEYIHGDYGIRARGSSMQQTYSPRSDDIYFNQRKRMWRGTDSEYTDEEINELALEDLKRFQKNKETVGSWDHGLHKVDLPTSAGGAGGPVKIDILKNPTKQEFDRWARGKFRDFYRRPDVEEWDEPGVRVITDVNGNVYVWDADDALHHDVIKGTGMQYDYEDDWTDVDSIDIDDLFNQLVKGGIYEKAYE